LAAVDWVTAGAAEFLRLEADFATVVSAESLAAADRTTAGSAAPWAGAVSAAPLALAGFIMADLAAFVTTSPAPLEAALLRATYAPRAGRDGESFMTNLALYVQLEAKPGKEKQLADFLTGALPLVEAERSTTAWFAMKMGPSTFGIFDAFPDEEGREAHLSGAVAKALMAKAPELLASAPSIHRIDILADKLPH
jgi:quinol monooxygenase YgiN